MIVDTLNSSELEECKQRLKQVVNSINNKRVELSLADSLEISKRLTRLNSLISRIAIRQIDEIVTDLEQPKERIREVTGKLGAAIEELEEVNKFVQILTNLTNLVSAILKPASGGLVKIAAIVDQLNNFT